jgi:undecaprenyl-diphosphatase
VSPEGKTSDLTDQRIFHSRKKSWILFGITLLIFIVLLAADTRIISYLQQQISDQVVSIANFLQYYGNLPFYFTFAFLLIYSLVKKSDKLKKVSWAYIKAQVIFSLVTIRILKTFFGRLRPRYGSEFTFFSLHFSENSFPSGHSTDAFISGIFLFYLLQYSKYSKYRFLPLVYAAIIALSRIACFAHFPSDVIAGTALGIFGAHYFLDRLPGRVEGVGSG